VDSFRRYIKAVRAWHIAARHTTTLYDRENKQSAGLRQVVRRQRTSDPYFDKECRDARRLTRRLERVYAVASRGAATSAPELNEPRRLIQLWVLMTWRSTLWMSVDSLLGRGRMPANDLIDDETFNRFFAEKVSSTSDVTSLTFIQPDVLFAALSVNVVNVQQLPD